MSKIPDDEPDLPACLSAVQTGRTGTQAGVGLVQKWSFFKGPAQADKTGHPATGLYFRL